jgi:hypothetical protein
LLFVWIWLDGRNKRVNPTVALEAGELCRAERRVPVDQVSRFSIYKDSASMEVGGSSVGSSVTASTALGVALFLLVDGSEVEFTWASLDDQQLDELRTALEEVLPGRWRPLDTLRQSDTTAVAAIHKSAMCVLPARAWPAVRASARNVAQL